MPITLEKFKEEFNGAPFTLEEFAFELQKVSDCPVLVKKANQYLTAMRELETALKTFNIEQG